MGIGRRALLIGVVFAALLATAPVAAQEPSDPPGGQDSPALALRVSLSRLLGEHAFLLMEEMRTVALGGDDAAALDRAIRDNTDDLAAAISSVYGDEAGRAFGDLWAEHIDLAVEYARATARGDRGAAQLALDGLARFSQSFTTFLADANPHLHGDAEAVAVQLHLDQLAAFTDKDYRKAYAAQREAFRHMFALGDHVALAIGKQFPDRFPGTEAAFSRGSGLRLSLDRLLGEHLILSAEAMRAGLSAAPDADAAVEALDGNSGDLSDALGTFYGSDAATQFGSLWRRHIDAYLSYIEAVRSEDQTEESAALDTLHQYHEEIARFLSAANPHLEESAVEDAIRRHVQALITQVDAYAARDFDRSVATIRGAYSQMFDVGNAVAAAIVRQFPEQFEALVAAPPTDLAPAGGTSERAALLRMLVALMASSAVVVGWSWILTREDP